LVVVDDGSSDQTAQVLSPYRDERILYHRYPHNRGASYARNRGVELCTSEYVAFLDSDDELVPEAVAQVFAVLDQTQRIYWLYRFPVLDAKTRQRIGRLPSKSGTVITYLDVLTKEYDAETFAVVRRRAFDFYRFCEDFLTYEKTFWLSVLKYLGPEYYADTPVRLYHTDTIGGSIMQSLTKRTPRIMENSKRQSLKYLELFGGDLLAVNRKDYKREVTKLCVAQLYLGEYREAARTAKIAIRVHPCLRFVALLIMANLRTVVPLELRYNIINFIGDFTHFSKIITFFNF
jgi:glycosyltransferase involved in cell wall biosynthesis